MLHADVPGERSFEVRNFWPHDVIAMVQNALYCRVNVWLEALVLLFEIDKLHGQESEDPEGSEALIGRLFVWAKVILSRLIYVFCGSHETTTVDYWNAQG